MMLADRMIALISYPGNLIFKLLKFAVKSYKLKAPQQFYGFSGLANFDICARLTTVTAGHWATPTNSMFCDSIIENHIDGLTIMVITIIILVIMPILVFYPPQSLKDIIVYLFLRAAIQEKKLKAAEKAAITRARNKRNEEMAQLLQTVIDIGLKSNNKDVRDFVDSFKFTIDNRSLN